MAPVELLKDVEADLAVFVSFPGEIRDRVKSGVAEMRAIRDEVETVITAATSDAKATLAKLKADAAVLAPKA